MSKSVIPPKTGAFYVANKSIVHDCDECGKTHRSRPRVAAYNAKLDRSGAQAHKHPLWPSWGWLAVWYCRRGGYFYTTVPEELVAKWGAEGWHYE